MTHVTLIGFQQRTEPGRVVVASPTVTAEVVVGTGKAAARHRTTLRLSWYASDPLAVHLMLTAQPDHPSLPRGRWTMLRDFLRYGLSHATGDGDVRVRPAPGGASVLIDLLRDGRTTTVRAASSTIREMLDATEAVVPAGEEQSAAALDELIARLTAPEPPPTSADLR